MTADDETRVVVATALTDADNHGVPDGYADAFTQDWMSDWALFCADRIIERMQALGWMPTEDVRAVVAQANLNQVRAEQERDALRAQLDALTGEVNKVEKQIRLFAYTSAGDPARADDMKMFALWAGALQKALAAARDAAKETK